MRGGVEILDIHHMKIAQEQLLPVASIAAHNSVATHISPWPPYMQPNDFVASGLWPLGRTLLFVAMKERKFHNFLMVSGLTKQGVRVIDVQSALAYLKSLSDKAAADPNPAVTEMRMEEEARKERAKRGRQARQRNLKSA